jgi:uncharacterized protein with PhoU and TrkA domain
MKKKSLEDIVLEIKDKSELMVDLAYSSLLYDNKIIAKEVYNLENFIDSLFQKIQKDTLDEVKRGKLPVDSALTLMRLGQAGEEIADAAQEIADVELRDVELHPILKLSIRESDEILTKIQIQSNSILCGKTLGKLKLGSETGMMIIAMKHKKRWLYGPNKNTRIDADDILFAKGPEDGEKHLLNLAKGISNEL